MLVRTNAGGILMLDSLFKTTGGWVQEWSLHLFQNDYSPNVNSVLGDFTEADYTGYAAVTFDTTDMQAAFVNTAGVPELDFPATVFRPGDPTATPNDIYGWYITETDNNTVLMAERFSGAPIPLASPLDQLTVLVRYTSMSQGG